MLFLAMAGAAVGWGWVLRAAVGWWWAARSGVCDSVWGRWDGEDDEDGEEDEGGREGMMFVRGGVAEERRTWPVREGSAVVSEHQDW